MKILVLTLVFIITCTSTLSAYEYDRLTFEVLREFPQGKEEGSFDFYDNPYEPNWPTAVAPYKDKLYIFEYAPGRLYSFDKNDIDGGFQIEKSGYFETLVSNQHLLVGHSDLANGFFIKTSTKLNNNYGNTMGQVFDYFRKLDYNMKDSAITDDFMFIQLNDSKGEVYYYGIYIPSENLDELQFIMPDALTAFLENEYAGEQEYTFDEQGYLFWNGRLVSPKKELFVSYWEERKGVEAPPITEFRGWDIFGNSYWQAGNRGMTIFDPDLNWMHTVMTYQINVPMRASMGVDEDGTLYAFTYDKERKVFPLLKLDPFWNEMHLQNEE